MYIVSFNNGDYQIGGYEEGDTENYYGPNVNRLVKHVIAADPEYPMVFRRVKEASDGTVGYFYGTEDNDQVAVMYRGQPTLPVFVK